MHCLVPRSNLLEPLTLSETMDNLSNLEYLLHCFIQSNLKFFLHNAKACSELAGSISKLMVSGLHCFSLGDVAAVVSPWYLPAQKLVPVLRLSYALVSPKESHILLLKHNFENSTACWMDCIRSKLCLPAVFPWFDFFFKVKYFVLFNDVGILYVLHGKLAHNLTCPPTQMEFCPVFTLEWCSKKHV